MIDLKISVIIPVYNVERYIERCARSLMEQTMKEGIEFIFINDCTPDKSMDVLERVIAEYPDRKKQVHIIHHFENKGIAFTRGEGIKEAKGEYIGWCDSDDWCEPDMFEKMYTATKGGMIDVVVCNAFRHTENEISVVSNVECKRPENYLKMIYSIPKWQCFSVLYSKLIRKTIFVGSEIYPYEGVNRSEDLNVMIRVCCVAKTITFVNEAMYHYNKMNMVSITHLGFKAKEDWFQQKRNVDLISNFLLAKKPENWKILRAFLQFSAKTECRKAFDTPQDFFETYRSSHWYILKFSAIPLRNRINMFLVYNVWFLFRIRNSSAFNS